MKSLYKVLLVLSPLFASMLASAIQQRISENPGNMATGIFLGAVAILGVPFVSIVGITVSFLSKNNARDISLYGYFGAAVLTWLLALAGIFT